jgi:hypothetical protein
MADAANELVLSIQDVGQYIVYLSLVGAILTINQSLGKQFANDIIDSLLKYFSLCHNFSMFKSE